MNREFEDKIEKEFLQENKKETIIQILSDLLKEGEELIVWQTSLTKRVVLSAALDDLSPKIDLISICIENIDNINKSELIYITNEANTIVFCSKILITERTVAIVHYPKILFYKNRRSIPRLVFSDDQGFCFYLSYSSNKDLRTRQYLIRNLSEYGACLKIPKVLKNYLNRKDNVEVRYRGNGISLSISSSVAHVSFNDREALLGLQFHKKIPNNEFKRILPTGE